MREKICFGRWAVQFGVPIIGVREADERRGAAEFADERRDAPDDLKFIFDSIEFLTMRRR